MDKSLGEKIKEYRVRAGLSQFELEDRIKASNGSISRIENNTINPTKETLRKIFQVLDLSSLEKVELIGLSIYTPEALIEGINLLAQTLDVETTLQTSVDILYDIFPGYLGGSILLLEGDTLRLKAVSKKLNIAKASKYIGLDLNKLEISIYSGINNLTLKTFREGESFQSSILSDFGIGFMDKHVIDLLQRFIGVGSGVTIPLKSKSKIFGVTMFIRKSKDRFSESEIDLLEKIVEQFSLAIRRNELIKEVSDLYPEIKDKILQQF